MPTVAHWQGCDLERVFAKRVPPAPPVLMHRTEDEHGVFSLRRAGDNATSVDPSIDGACLYINALHPGGPRAVGLAELLERDRTPFTMLQSSTSAPHSRLADAPCMTGVRAGYVGMWLSMRKAWLRASQRCSASWVVVLEDDARGVEGLAHRFQQLRACSSHEYLSTVGHSMNAEIYWLDQRVGLHRGPNGCCTVAMAYHKRLLPRLLHHFDPAGQDAYWTSYASAPKAVVNRSACLTDWYLGNLVHYLRAPAMSVGFVEHGAGLGSDICPARSNKAAGSRFDCRALVASDDDAHRHDQRPRSRRRSRRSRRR